MSSWGLFGCPVVFWLSSRDYSRPTLCFILFFYWATLPFWSRTSGLDILCCWPIVLCIVPSGGCFAVPARPLPSLCTLRHIVLSFSSVYLLLPLLSWPGIEVAPRVIRSPSLEFPYAAPLGILLRHSSFFRLFFLKASSDPRHVASPVLLAVHPTRRPCAQGALCVAKAVTGPGHRSASSSSQFTPVLRSETLLGALPRPPYRLHFRPIPTRYRPLPPLASPTAPTTSPQHASYGCTYPPRAAVLTSTSPAPASHLLNGRFACSTFSLVALSAVCVAWANCPPHFCRAPTLTPCTCLPHTTFTPSAFFIPSAIRSAPHRPTVVIHRLVFHRLSTLLRSSPASSPISFGLSFARACKSLPAFRSCTLKRSSHAFLISAYFLVLFERPVQLGLRALVLFPSLSTPPAPNS